MCKLKPLLARWLDEADATNSDLASTSTVTGTLQSSLDRLGTCSVTRRYKLKPRTERRN